MGTGRREAPDLGDGEEDVVGRTGGGKGKQRRKETRESSSERIMAEYGGVQQCRWAIKKGTGHAGLTRKEIRPQNDRKDREGVQQSDNP